MLALSWEFYVKCFLSGIPDKQHITKQDFKNLAFGEKHDFKNLAFGEKRDFKNLAFGEKHDFKNLAFGEKHDFKNLAFGESALDFRGCDLV